jgi:integrase
MSLYKRKGEDGGVWWFHFQFKGNHYQQSTGVRNKRDAETIASAYRTQLAMGTVGIEPEEEPAEVPLFDAAMIDFLAWSETEYAAHPASHRRYVISSKALLRHFGNVQLDRITADDVEKFKVTRSKQRTAPRGRKSSKKRRAASKQLRPASVNRELACLKHLFSRNETAIPKNPVSSVKLLDEDNQQTRVLSTDEEKLYLLAASQPLQDIATMMLETGMRPEEVCRIST